MAKRRIHSSKQKVRIAVGLETVEGKQVPFEVWVEHRRNVLFSMTRLKAILRLPIYLPQENREKEFASFREWIKKASAKRPDLVASQQQTRYLDGETWSLGQYTYTLHIAEEDRKTASAQLFEPDGTSAELSLKLPVGMSEPARSKTIEKLMYRLAAKHALPRIEALLDEINDTHFQVEVGRIKLSPTSSRWGSCSSRGNINLSTRLLAAPEMCLRAVIVHELAHRIEMNHSIRFWNLVYDVMPDYGKADAWLKKYGKDAKWVRSSADLRNSQHALSTGL